MPLKTAKKSGRRRCGSSTAAGFHPALRTPPISLRDGVQDGLSTSRVWFATPSISRYGEPHPTCFTGIGNQELENRPPSDAFKVISVKFLYCIRFVVGDADAVIYHVLRKLNPIDQDDTEVCLCSCFLRARGKSSASDKHAFARLVFTKRTNEFPDGTGADVGFMSFGLNVNHVQTKAIFLDYTVDSIVTAFTDDLGRVELRTAIAHRNKYIYDQLLKRLRLHRSNAFKNFVN